MPQVRILSSRLISDRSSQVLSLKFEANQKLVVFVEISFRGSCEPIFFLEMATLKFLIQIISRVVTI